MEEASATDLRQSEHPVPDSGIGCSQRLHVARETFSPRAIGECFKETTCEAVSREWASGSHAARSGPHLARGPVPTTAYNGGLERQRDPEWAADVEWGRVGEGRRSSPRPSRRPRRRARHLTTPVLRPAALRVEGEVTTQGDAPTGGRTPGSPPAMLALLPARQRTLRRGVRLVDIFQ